MRIRKTRGRTRKRPIWKSFKIDGSPERAHNFLSRLLQIGQEEVVTNTDTENMKIWHNENKQNKGMYQETSDVEILEVDASPETTKISTSQAFGAGIDGDILKDVGSDKVGAPAKVKPQPRSENAKEKVERSQYHDQAEKHSQHKQEPAPMEISKLPTCIQQMHEGNAHEESEEDQLDNILCEVESVYHDNHAMDDHDVISHAIGNHEVCQGHGDETDQDGVESEIMRRWNGKSVSRWPVAERVQKNQSVTTTMCGKIVMRNATRSGPMRLLNTTRGKQNSLQLAEANNTRKLNKENRVTHGQHHG